MTLASRITIETVKRFTELDFKFALLSGKENIPVISSQVYILFIFNSLGDYISGSAN